MGFWFFNRFTCKKHISYFPNYDPDEANISNTFDPILKEYLSVNDIITLLELGSIKFKQLPEDVKFRVATEMLIKHPEIRSDLKISKWKMKSYSKKTLEGLKW